ncbi:hypothetical protein H4217_000856 [Coemansia sp. RSA 1939]|nr:hypothetical protein H4217_000856 [Coemansia sp. RSA 1939]
MSNEKRFSRPRSWLSVVARQTSIARPAEQSVSVTRAQKTGPYSDSYSYSSPSLFHHPAPPLPPRSRTGSCASDDTCMASAQVEPSPPLNKVVSIHATKPGDGLCSAHPHGGNEHYCAAQLIDPTRTDMAIASALRARQEDRAGNHGEAVRLLVASVEYMAASVEAPNFNCTCSSYGTGADGRLAALRWWLQASGSSTPVPQKTQSTAGSRSSAKHSDYSHTCPLSNTHGVCGDAGGNDVCAFERAADGLRSTVLVGAAKALDMLNQMLVLWLVVLGNMVAWAAVRFKESELPETVAQYALGAGVWIYTVGRQRNVHVYAARFGRRLVRWLASVDKETRFSSKIICSLAAILGAVARVAEESTKTASDSNCSDATAY